MYFVMGTDPENGKWILLSRRGFLSHEEASAYAGTVAPGYLPFVVVST